MRPLISLLPKDTTAWQSEHLSQQNLTGVEIGKRLTEYQDICIFLKKMIG